MHGGDTVLKQYLGKAAGRSADIERMPARNVEFEVIERVFELQCGARDILLRIVGNLDLGCRIYGLAGLGG